jgi:hypothetical protein
VLNGLFGDDSHTVVKTIKPVPKTIFQTAEAYREAMMRLYTCPSTGAFDAPHKRKKSKPHFTILKQYGTRDIITNVKGKIPIEFANYMAMHGMDVDKQTLRDAEHHNGGHPCLRTTVNIMVAEMWLRIRKAVLMQPA